MEIRQLQYFVAAAEAGTISRAAERCGVTQPSLSQQIIKLEEELDVTLFDRLGRGVALTEAGTSLLPRARNILTHVNDAETSIRNDLDAGRGTLAIGAIPTMAPYLIPALVAQLRVEHPECDIIIREDLSQNLIEAVIDGELDVAIMSTPVDHKLIKLEVIGREPFLVVVPAAHAIAGADGAALADVRDQPAITLHEMHCLGKQISDFCATKRLASNVICRTTQIATLLEFVRLGLGLSIVPAMVADHDDHPGRTYLPFKQSIPSRDIAVIQRAGRTRSRLARSFVESLRKHLADD